MKGPAARLLLLPVFYKLYNVFAFNKVLLVFKRNTFSYLFKKTKILGVKGELVKGIDYLNKYFFIRSKQKFIGSWTRSFFLVCLSLIWMSGSNMTKTPSLFADPSNEGYNCNKTWLLLPNYYRTDVLRPSTFRWFGGLLSLLITAQKWAEILG